ncbi:hypothetical protein [Actinoallomurus vinaceus]
MSSDIEWQADERPAPAAGRPRGGPSARRVFGVPPTRRGARQ